MPNTHQLQLVASEYVALRERCAPPVEINQVLETARGMLPGRVSDTEDKLDETLRAIAAKYAFEQDRRAAQHRRRVLAAGRQIINTVRDQLDTHRISAGAVQIAAYTAIRSAYPSMPEQDAQILASEV
jgi:hypothetical protein